MPKWEYAAILIEGKSRFALVPHKLDKIIIRIEFESMSKSITDNNKKYLNKLTGFNLSNFKIIKQNKKSKINLEYTFNYDWKKYFQLNDQISNLNSVFSSADFSKGLMMEHNLKIKFEKIELFKPIVKSDDLLKLINLAGAKGWEITGGIGLGNSEPGVHETRWRIMRREI